MVTTAGDQPIKGASKSIDDYLLHQTSSTNLSICQSVVHIIAGNQ